MEIRHAHAAHRGHVSDPDRHGGAGARSGAPPRTHKLPSLVAVDADDTHGATADVLHVGPHRLNLVAVNADGGDGWMLYVWTVGAAGLRIVGRTAMFTGADAEREAWRYMRELARRLEAHERTGAAVCPLT